MNSNQIKELQTIQTSNKNSITNTVTVPGTNTVTVPGTNTVTVPSTNTITNTGKFNALIYFDSHIFIEMIYLLRFVRKSGSSLETC